MNADILWHNEREVGTDILWHNAATNETQIWLMDNHKIAGRATVLGEDGNPAFVGLPWSIVGAGDFNRDGTAEILWHNTTTDETQIWFMARNKIAARATVVGEDGKPVFVGLPWSIVGAGDFNQDGNSDILWHNATTNETQIWFMTGNKIAARATVVGEDEKPVFVGLPWSIVGAGDFNQDGNSDILWHNETTNETQIWFMTGNKIAARGTVLGEDGKPAFVGLPWSIVGAGDINRLGTSSIVWHNASTNESQIWLTVGNRIAGRMTIVGEDTKPALVGEPWNIVGAGDFDRSGTGETQLWRMDHQKIATRATVVGEDGKPALVGFPWEIVGAGDFDRNASADILWHNALTNETQLWLMDDEKIVSRATIVGEDGNPAFVGLPWSIVGAGDFDRNGNADILWHNGLTNETQIWLMDRHKIASRATVVGEDGKPAFVGLPWRIVGAGDFDRDGNADILWHNGLTNETQIWLMDRHKIAGRATVVGENGNPVFVGLPWRIVGSGLFSFRAGAIQKIHEFYVKSGAHRGLLGLPLTDVQFDGDGAEQRFAGGFIRLLDTMPNPKGTATTCVRVRFVGFHCDQESSHDQLSGSDEPYFIIGVAGSNRSSTMRFGPYDGVDSGTVKFEAAMLADPFGTSPIIICPPIVIGVVAMEHDEGTPEEAENKVRDIFKAIEDKFDQAAAMLGGTTAGSHVMPEWARDIVIGWAPEGIAAVFGLGDDNIGAVPLVMFDFNPGLDKWTTPPQIGVHGQNPYNTEIVVDGGDEGKYTLRFNVEIAEINTTVG